jgi:hypothetical protein
MDGVADNVINQESDATDAQCFSGESAEIVWSQMVDEKIAAHQVEGIVRERQGQRIASHSAIAAVQVSAGAVEQRNGEVKMCGKTLSDLGGNKARSGGDFEKRSTLTIILRESSADEFLGRPNAAEPPVEHLQIAERARDFALGSCVGIQ